jgi:hypothetical protein
MTHLGSCSVLLQDVQHLRRAFLISIFIFRVSAGNAVDCMSVELFSCLTLRTLMEAVTECCAYNVPGSLSFKFTDGSTS